MLQISPTLALEVGSDRRLRADVIKSPAASNALKLRSDGLYLKRGRRLYGWSLVQPTTNQVLALVAQANQVVNWGTDPLDAGNVFDPAVSVTRVTLPEAGRWFTKASVLATLVGGTAAAAGATCFVLLNGTQVVAGDTQYIAAAASTGIGPNVNGYINAAAGDYLEIYWRWLGFTTLTATSATLLGSWTGFRVSS